MKTINQVLLALIFVAFSTIGFAQSNTTAPLSTVKLNDDYRFKYEDEEEEEEEVEEGAVIIDEEQVYFLSLGPQNATRIKNSASPSMWAPTHD